MNRFAVGASVMAFTLVTTLVRQAPLSAQSGAPDLFQWGISTAAPLGLDKLRIDTLDVGAASGAYPLVDEILIIRCGNIVFRRTYRHDYANIYANQALQRGPLNAHLSGPYNYFDSTTHPYYQKTEEHSLQSITKTVASAVLGVAVTRGDFKSSLETPLLHYFALQAVRNLDSRKRRITLRHLLTMSSGIEWYDNVPVDDSRNSSAQMEASQDWIEFAIDQPMKDEPGSRFVYNSGGSELLAYVFLRETGEDMETYARNNLFAPLGIREFHWKRTPLGMVDTEGGLYLKASDLAKIGYLYAHGGTWDGRRLLSADWIRQSTTPSIEVEDDEAVAGDPATGPAAAGSRGDTRTESAKGAETSLHWAYGFQWWILPSVRGRPTLWAARGFGGQNLFVFPERDLIVVLTSWNILGTSLLEHDAITQLSAAMRPDDANTRSTCRN